MLSISSSSKRKKRDLNMGDLITRQDQVEISIEELRASLEASSEEQVERKGECRVCHEEDFVSRLEAPCKCNGSLKYAHRKCIEHWCNIKSSIRCEICREIYSPNYSVTEPPPSDDEDIPMSDQWTPFDPIDRVTTRISRSMNRDFSWRNPSAGVIFGTLLLVVVALNILKDAYYFTPPKEDKLGRFMYFTVIIIAVPIYILQCHVLWRDERERMEREREREMERERES